jgi:CRISPR-associated endonuclease/helicase Cas3
VDDLADKAADLYAARYLAMRLHPTLWPREDGCLSWTDAWPKLREAAEKGTEKSARALRTVLQGDDMPKTIRQRAQRFDNANRPRMLFPYAHDAEDQITGAVLIAPYGVPAPELNEEPGGATTEDDLGGSFAGQPISLERHVGVVVAQATRIADAVGLPDTVANALRFAARHHDDGKRDVRFQAWLQGPDAPSDTLLAKSDRRRSLAEEQAARLAAGVPPRWRHEALSVRAAILILATCDDSIDADLALYLIGTHHGHGRPFFVHDDPWDAHGQILPGTVLAPSPGPQRLDFDWRGQDWPGLFAMLRDRYGAWGLAFLEALLRLADHRASEKPG